MIDFLAQTLSTGRFNTSTGITKIRYGIAALLQDSHQETSPLTSEKGKKRKGRKKKIHGNKKRLSSFPLSFLSLALPHFYRPTCRNSKTTEKSGRWRPLTDGRIDIDGIFTPLALSRSRNPSAHAVSLDELERQASSSSSSSSSSPTTRSSPTAINSIHRPCWPACPKRIFACGGNDGPASSNLGPPSSLPHPNTRQKDYTLFP